MHEILCLFFVSLICILEHPNEIHSRISCRHKTMPRVRQTLGKIVVVYNCLIVYSLLFSG